MPEAITIPIGFQGYPGSFSDEALDLIVKAFKKDPRGDFHYEPEPLPDFREVVNRLLSLKLGLALLPIENRLAASVIPVRELLSEFHPQIFIRGEIIHRIRLCLIAHKGVQMGNVREAWSHYMALNQCSRFLRENNIVPVERPDTAGSVKMLLDSGRRDVAAVAGPRCVEIYPNTAILSDRIANRKRNYTRFLLLSRADFRAPSFASFRMMRTSISFRLVHRPGAMYAALGALRPVNITKLETYPILPDEEDDDNGTEIDPFQYVFYVDFIGSMSEPHVARAIGDLRKVCSALAIHGSYPVL
ncbi:MAG: hypothetical protein M1282_00955 [Chloroflexi bacterium]|nr:hypothetical protein [Chloroflexota bacterium]